MLMDNCRWSFALRSEAQSKPVREEPALSYAPTRYVASFIIEFISDFLRFSVEKYRFSAEEIAIVCLVAAESTRELRRDAFVAKNYGSEESAFPNGYRAPVSLKFIHVSLGMSRETTRRKLERLARDGYLIRGKGGYTLPAQTGVDDFTKELRAFLLEKLTELNTYIKKMPS
jgi:biotin operon repressor